MRALVTGSSGFIGTHLVKRLRAEGHDVWGADRKPPQYNIAPTKFMKGDLRDPVFCQLLFRQPFDETYHLAAEMGGAGFIFSGDNDFDIMSNSAQMNLNIARQAAFGATGKLFFSSSACVYPEYPWGGGKNGWESLKETAAYPADPDSEYGWEKIFAERLYGTVARNVGNVLRVARLHNVFGPMGTWDGGREKAPAAICRKVAQAQDGGEIEIWGDGTQLRSFLYIDECIEGIRRLMASDFAGPVNLGSEQMISINQLVDCVSVIAGKTLRKKHVKGPTGVQGRNSNNELIREKLGWAPEERLIEGLKETYNWIANQVKHAA